MGHAARRSTARTGRHIAAIQTCQQIGNLVLGLLKCRDQASADERQDLGQRQARLLVAAKGLRHHLGDGKAIKIMPLQKGQQMMAQLVDGLTDIGCRCEGPIGQIV